MQCAWEASVLENLTADQVTSDSRKAGPEKVFFAFPSWAHDVKDFVDDAIQHGCREVVLSPQDVVDSRDVKFHVTTDVVGVFAQVLHRLLPVNNHSLWGVTGTNGKTTVTYLIRHLLGRPTALIGSIVDDLLVESHEAAQTTPSLESLYRMIAAIPKNTPVAIELSSHGLDQRRHCGLQFDAAIFTNLTSDHLDYHGDSMAYFTAKRKLFTDAPKPRCNVFNIGDPYGERLWRELWGVTYGVNVPADYQAQNIQLRPEGTFFNLKHYGKCYPCRSPLLGDFNVENALAAIAAIHEVEGIELEKLCQRLATFPGVPGRLERIIQINGVTIFVDFAHTEDGLRRVLQTLQKLKPKKIITVFGCGGDRDRTKRPKMMQVACERSSLVIATADNPRHEAIEDIFHDMRLGVQHRNVLFEPDRRQAIEMALQRAQPGDIVLIAGKGHERYQVVGDQKIPFSDQDCVRTYFEAAKVL
ncbi:MAG: UDP-N-acetylmuramoyl-L-alanyl-D-glutamate--2,6-diaminopimelate ligase [Opitutales bacterium]|nr:UDP-N-acetylmuramoyl-L-alanyl-D-glutamate--2,6-diaminopimelate ligase [Opitutales bacterium]